MAKNGRQSKFDQVDLALVERLAKEGKTEAEICSVLEVDCSTFYRWKQKYPSFRMVLNSWKLEADRKVEEALYNRATGMTVATEQGMKELPPDTTACIFWLKNRNRNEWRDKQDIEHSGNLTITDMINKLTDNVEKDEE